VIPGTARAREASGISLLAASASVALLLAALLFVALALAACAPAEQHPAVERIETLLEMRRDDVRDPAAYREFFSDPALADALADASGEPTGTPRVPLYDPPYLTATGPLTADVAVVWKSDDAFPDWPAVNVFTLRLDGDRWVVVDAVEPTVTPEPLATEAAE
jgi:hypothetical protein